MNSKFLRIFVVAVTTLFLNTQAFALESAQKDNYIGKTDRDTSSMNDSARSNSTDHDKGNMDKRSNDDSQSMDPKCGAC